MKREEIRIKLEQQLIISHAKYDDCYFDDKGQEVDFIATANDNLFNENELIRPTSQTIGVQRQKYSDMLDPRSQVNAYGTQYTFEVEAIKEWIDG